MLTSSIVVFLENSAFKLKDTAAQLSTLMMQVSKLVHTLNTRLIAYADKLFNDVQIQKGVMWFTYKRQRKLLMSIATVERQS